MSLKEKISKSKLSEDKKKALLESVKQKEKGTAKPFRK